MQEEAIGILQKVLTSQVEYRGDALLAVIADKLLQSSEDPEMLSFRKHLCQVPLDKVPLCDNVFGDSPSKNAP